MCKIFCILLGLWFGLDYKQSYSGVYIGGIAEYDGVVPPSLLIVRSRTRIYLAVVDVRMIATEITHGESQRWRMHRRLFLFRLSDRNSNMPRQVPSVSCLSLTNAEPSPTLRTLSQLHWPIPMACAVRSGGA